MRRLVLAAMALALLAVATAALAAAKPAASPSSPTSEECLGCHADKGLRGGVDEAVLKASVHGRLQCTACHTGIAEVPHAEKLAPVACQKCHAQAAGTVSASIHGRARGAARAGCQGCHGTHGVVPAAKLGAAPCQACHEPVTRAYLTSVHARALARGIQDASLCFDCHGEAHQLRSHTDPDSSTFRSRTAETCGRCHADRALVE
ncbi:MAG: hypothetical protein HY713_14400, partial [candidate division NC10 bacterium]|nr:hypothetical protein [candidate division NC10 bacterium]